MTRQSRLSRRKFLQTAGVSLVAASISRAFAASAANCGLTAQTTAGPFYVGNAPSVADINWRKARGTPMQVGGTVFGGADGRQPLAGAIVEIWHCDADGEYHPDGSGDIARYPADAVNLRGIGITGADGRYGFTSIVPGHYGNRRRHIHWKFSAPGHRPLTTQSYWLDERGSARERSDFVDRNTDACRWVSFETDGAGVSTGRFDVVLEAIA